MSNPLLDAIGAILERFDTSEKNQEEHRQALITLRYRAAALEDEVADFRTRIVNSELALETLRGDVGRLDRTELETRKRLVELENTAKTPEHTGDADLRDENDRLRRALEAFVQTCKNTGGLMLSPGYKKPRLTHHPTWGDLANAYVGALEALGMKLTYTEGQ